MKKKFFVKEILLVKKKKIPWLPPWNSCKHLGVFIYKFSEWIGTPIGGLAGFPLITAVCHWAVFSNWSPQVHELSGFTGVCLWNFPEDSGALQWLFSSLATYFPWKSLKLWDPDTKTQRAGEGTEVKIFVVYGQLCHHPRGTHLAFGISLNSRAT